MGLRDFVKYCIGNLNYIENKLFSKYTSKLNIKKVKSGVIVNLAGIGDLLAMTPLIKRLDESKIKVDLMLNKIMFPLFEKNKNVNNLFSESDIKIMRKYDLGIIVYPQTIEIAKEIRNKVEYLISDTNYYALSKTPLYLNNLKEPVSVEKKHKVLQHLEFLDLIGLKYSKNLYENNIILNSNVKSIGKLIKKPYIIISPGSKNHIKAGINLFNRGKWIKVSNYLLSKGYYIVIIGAKDEADISNEIYDGISNKKKVINLAGKTDLNELIRVIKNAKLLVGIDSGAIHIGSALNVKIVDIIRENKSSIWHPWTNPKNYRIIKSDKNSLDSVSYQEVIERIDELL